MKEKSLMDVSNAMVNLLQKDIWSNMLQQFMKERGLLSVLFAILDFIKKDIIQIKIMIKGLET